MKFTISELIASKDKREELKDYLAGRVHAADKLKEDSYKPFQFQMPSEDEAYKLWLECQQSVHDLMILRELAEPDMEELERTLDSLYNAIESWKIMEKEYPFIRGFKQGYSYGRQVYTIVQENIMEKIGLLDLFIPLSDEAKKLKEADKEAGSDLKSNEKYNELGKEVEQEKNKVINADWKRRKARGEKIGLTDNPLMARSDAELDKIETKIADGASIEAALAELKSEESE
jgi:hypothetical protein